MDFRQLRYFVATAEELHFGKAAERVHIAQPALSLQIKALEESLGARLFNRNNRRVEMTQAGELLLREARQILTQVEATRKLIRRAANGKVGTLKIGYSANAAYSGIVASRIKAFKKESPDVYVELLDFHPTVQRQKLKNGEIDVAFVTMLAGLSDHELMTHKLAEWDFVVALPIDHPQACNKQVRLEDLANEEFIVYSVLGDREGTVLLDAITPFAARVTQEAQNIIGLTSMVAAGLGIALVPASIQGLQFADDLVYRPLIGMAAKVEVLLAWEPGNLDTIVEKFIAG